jgi:hypothetical protein
MAIDRFSGDDESYRAWVARNPQGYVVNTDRTPKAGYLIMHRATCEQGILSHLDRNPTLGFTKWCSLDMFDLIDELQRGTGGMVTKADCCFR